MNDIILASDFSKCFPTISMGIAKAQKVYSSIKSFDDIEKYFLKGAGLSPATYLTYKKAYKYLYDYTKGKSIFQIKPSDLECWFDDMLSRGLERNTACLRIKGVKKVLEGIRTYIPFYVTPFEVMSEGLKKKLNKTKKKATKRTLSKTDMKKLFAWLEQDQTVKGKENLAITHVLFTSGLRAAELLSLKWRDLEYCPEERKWMATFTAKGGDQQQTEIHQKSVGLFLDYYKVAFGKNPLPEDFLFWTVPSYHGDTPRPMPYPTLWTRFKDLGKKLREAEIITKNVVISPHLFRRTACTLFYKETKDIKSTQMFSRHKSADTLIKHYIESTVSASLIFDKILA